MNIPNPFGRKKSEFMTRREAAEYLGADLIRQLDKWVGYGTVRANSGGFGQQVYLRADVEREAAIYLAAKEQEKEMEALRRAGPDINGDPPAEEIDEILQPPRNPDEELRDEHVQSSQQDLENFDLGPIPDARKGARREEPRRSAPSTQPDESWYKRNRAKCHVLGVTILLVFVVFGLTQSDTHRTQEVEASGLTLKPAAKPVEERKQQPVPEVPVAAKEPESPAPIPTPPAVAKKPVETPASAESQKPVEATKSVEPVAKTESVKPKAAPTRQVSEPYWFAADRESELAQCARMLAAIKAVGNSNDELAQHIERLRQSGE